MNLQILYCLNLRSFLIGVLSILVLTISGAAQQDDNKPKPRDIVPVFESARPPTASVSGAGAVGVGGKPPQNTGGSGKPTQNNNRPPQPTYSRISSRINSGKISKIDRPGGKRPPRPVQENIAETRARQIGITLWQLNEVRPSSNLETLLQSINGKKRYLLPERASIDTIFQPNDLVRLAVESSRRGYLYIVDQEMFADGSLGDAYLVFPNKRIRGGANLSAPGKPVELPDAKGNPFYFELRPENQNGDKLTAEILTVIISDQPIPGLTIGEQPLLINEKTLNGWRTKWAGRAEIFESGSTGRYTKAEREAAAGNRSLSGSDPLPQTVFLVEGNRSGGSLITVPLWYGN